MSGRAGLPTPPTLFRSSSALTLIEVMVAMGVMVILLGGIFMVVQTSLRTVLLIDESASRRDEISRMIDILRAGFGSLPATARITAETTRIGGNEAKVFAFRDAPDFLTWLPGGEGAEMIVLFAAVRGETGWDLMLKRFLPGSRLPRNETRPQALLQAGAEVSWLPLVDGFREFDMRFYDAPNDDWLKDWTRPEVRPSLIQMTLDAPETENQGNFRPTFWIPPVKVRVVS